MTNLRFSRARYIYHLFLGIAFLSLMGCGSKARDYLDRIVIKPSSNLEIIRMRLIFKESVRLDFAYSFPIKEYGYLFINPYSSSSRFELGFDLDTAIFKDNEYLELEPRTVLPNGVPIGIDHALVEISPKKNSDRKVNIYGYVDILQSSWLGVASLFSFIDEKVLPAEFFLTQVFKRDVDRKPSVFVKIFGPTFHSDKSLDKSGGIAIFANFKALDRDLKTGQQIVLFPENQTIIDSLGELKENHFKWGSSRSLNNVYYGN